MCEVCLATPGLSGLNNLIQKGPETEKFHFLAPIPEEFSFSVPFDVKFASLALSLPRKYSEFGKRGV